MNLLLDRLPDTVMLAGKEYTIASDFRISIRFELLIQEQSLTDAELVAEALRLYYPFMSWSQKALLAQDAVRKALWFYSCGDERIRTDGMDDQEQASQEKRVYSFEHDDGYIYAAFLECYGLDLQRVRYLHWWRFRALFKALPDDCQFMKIVGYRSMKITSGMSKEQKSFYRKMQALYALPQSDDEVRRTNALISALKNGEDLTGLI